MAYPQQLWQGWDQQPVKQAPEDLMPGQTPGWVPASMQAMPYQPPAIQPEMAIRQAMPDQAMPTRQPPQEPVTPAITTPQPANNPNLGYNPDEFLNWYQSQYQAPPSAGLINRIGQLVGPPQGPNGQYSQAQWQQAQQQAQQDTPGFTPEFNAPTFNQGPAFDRGPGFDGGPGFDMGAEYNQGPAFNAGADYANAPMYQTPDAFKYDAFKAPTMAEAEADPGYQFGLQQGTKAIMGNKAAAGLARTGATLQNIMDYGRQAATQQYGDVYNRAAQGWSMNRSNAADAYATNYQIGRDAWRDRETAQQGAWDRNLAARESTFDRNTQANQSAWQMNQAARQGAFDRNFAARESVYDRNQRARESEWQMNQAARESAFDRNYKGASDAFNARFRGRELTFQDLYSRWKDKLVTATQLQLANTPPPR